MTLSGFSAGDSERDRRLSIAVELAAGASATPRIGEQIADAVLAVLTRLNSEFVNYVPQDRQRPSITLWPAGHPEYFPVGVKHRYSRK